ncbi:MAG: hypothetical protein ACK4UN_05365, partial [Limisphaerales bacterium]
ELSGLVRHGYKRHRNSRSIVGSVKDSNLQRLLNGRGNGEEGYPDQEKRRCERRQDYLRSL